MSKPATGGFLGTLDPTTDLPLYRQLYQRIRDLILDGTLERGARLASTRALASDLGVSRNTVLLAVDLLASEGYLEGKVGAGTFVCCCIPEDREAPPPPGRSERPPLARTVTLSRRARGMARLPRGGDDSGVRPFVAGVPALDEFPWETWARLWRTLHRNPSPELLCYGEPEGYRPLREEVAAYLRSARGVRCHWRQVVVVSSTQQALDLAARLLVNPGDPVWIEEPGYLGARGALTAAEARLVPVPVDEQGLDVDAGRARCPDARLVYVTPSHQFPLGSVMSLERRLALLDWASRRESWILEDDYDSEFRFVGRPLPALQGLDGDDRVIYVGTFAKVVFPSIRLAYLVLPPDLADAFRAVRTFADRHSPTLPQAVLAEFFRRGHFTAHLRRMRALYARRQRQLIDALREAEVPLRVREDEAGMHLVTELPEGADDRALTRSLAEAGVSVAALSSCYLEGPGRSGLVLGYSALSREAIVQGVSMLRQIVARPSRP